jgi:hypothetical protein
VGESWHVITRAEACGHAAWPTRLVAEVIKGVVVFRPQETQGSDGDNDDHHDHSHKGDQDLSDHATIPLTWPWGGASQAHAAIDACLPRKCEHP